MTQRKGGMNLLQVGGVTLDTIGDATYGMGNPVREAIVGSAGVVGYKETPQVAFVETEIVDRGNLDVVALQATDGATVTHTLPSGKVLLLRNAWYAGEGQGETSEGKLAVRFESRSPAEEILTP